MSDSEKEVTEFYRANNSTLAELCMAVWNLTAKARNIAHQQILQIALWEDVCVKQGKFYCGLSQCDDAKPNTNELWISCGDIWITITVNKPMTRLVKTTNLRLNTIKLKDVVSMDFYAADTSEDDVRNELSMALLADTKIAFKER